MMNATNLYQNVVNITADYLGPAGQRFVDRQIINHLGISPESITKHDLTNFIDWARIALAVVTDDGDLVDEYADRLLMLKKIKPGSSAI